MPRALVACASAKSHIPETTVSELNPVAFGM